MVDTQYAKRFCSMDPIGQFSGQKLLITGANGFLGHHLSRRVCESGAEVHAVARNLPTDRDTYLRWWEGDVSDLTTVKRLFINIQPDIVFHLTSHGVGAPDFQLVFPTLSSDFLATINVLTAATQHGCPRVVVTASLEEPQPGSEEITPSSPYAAAKWASGAYARMFHRLYGTPVVIVRPFMTYGPGQRSHKIIPQVTLDLLRGRSPRLSSGRREVDWVYVDDVIDGFLAAAQQENVEGSTIDLGSGILVSIREVVMQLATLIDANIEPSFGALPDRPFEKIRAADVEFAYAKLRWSAETTLESGLAQTVEWYRAHLNAFLEKK